MTTSSHRMSDYASELARWDADPMVGYEGPIPMLLKFACLQLSDLLHDIDTSIDKLSSLQSIHIDLLFGACYNSPHVVDMYFLYEECVCDTFTSVLGPEAWYFIDEKHPFDSDLLIDMAREYFKSIIRNKIDDEKQRNKKQQNYDNIEYTFEQMFECYLDSCKK